MELEGLRMRLRLIEDQTAGRVDETDTEESLLPGRSAVVPPAVLAANPQGDDSQAK